MPGEDCAMNLKLNKMMVLENNQQFTIRSGASTVGTGKVRYQSCAAVIPNHCSGNRKCFPEKKLIYQYLHNVVFGFNI